MHNDSSRLPESLHAFTRTIDFLGMEGFERLQRAFVVVLGLGGVGSHAAQALVRSGVGRLRLVDFDDVSISSLNRHAVATAADVDQPKTEVCKEAFQRIQPAVEIETAQAFFHEDQAETLLAGNPDFVVDAIDALNPKVALLQYCLAHRLPVVSSMGASARSDPSRLRIADISKTEQCPLAKRVRKMLRRRGIEGGVKVVYSLEIPMMTLPPDEEGHWSEKQGRIRNRLPSFAVMPAIFGNALAGECLKDLAGFDAKRFQKPPRPKG